MGQKLAIPYKETNINTFCGIDNLPNYYTPCACGYNGKTCYPCCLAYNGNNRWCSPLFCCSDQEDESCVISPYLCFYHKKDKGLAERRRSKSTYITYFCFSPAICCMEYSVWCVKVANNNNNNSVYRISYDDTYGKGIDKYIDTQKYRLQGEREKFCWCCVTNGSMCDANGRDYTQMLSKPIEDIIKEYEAEKLNNSTLPSAPVQQIMEYGTYGEHDSERLNSSTGGETGLT